MNETRETIGRIEVAPEVLTTIARFATLNVNGVVKLCPGTADSGHLATYRFCPVCGSTVAYVVEGWPGLVAVPLGAFADPSFPPPRFSVYEDRKHPWTTVLGDEVDHSSEPSSVRLSSNRPA